MTGISTIYTPRLLLRPLMTGDTETLHRIWTDPEVRRYLWDNEIITVERAQQTVNAMLDLALERGLGTWCVCMREEAIEVIGFTGFRMIGDSDNVELLYGLLPEHWHKGIATEAARAAVSYFFATHTIERLFAGADRPNAASFRVMQRLGLRKLPEGYIAVPNAIYFYVDRSDWSTDKSAWWTS